MFEMSVGHYCMKNLVVICFTLLWMSSCNDYNPKFKLLQDEINHLNNVNDSLNLLVQKSKPGLGEIMLGIQVHHNKLWFAGKEGNWKLARFEHDEIMELLLQAETIEKERAEVKLFKAMIYPQLDTLSTAINKENSGLFIQSFTNLTYACNGCHKAVNYGFNTIIIPDSPPYSNQKFSLNE
jgi:hypothetical protein